MTARAGTGVTACLSIVILASMPAAANADPAATTTGDYTVASVKADFDTTKTIGKRKAGLMCLPAGNFQWRDARLGMSEALDTVATALSERVPEHFRSVDPAFGEVPAPTRFRVTATITEWNVDACQKNWGIAARITKRKNLIGRSAMTVRWEIADRATRTKAEPLAVTTRSDIASDSGDLVAVLKEALRLNSADFARRQWGDGRTG